MAGGGRWKRQRWQERSRGRGSRRGMVRRTGRREILELGCSDTRCGSRWSLSLAQTIVCETRGTAKLDPATPNAARISRSAVKSRLVDCELTWETVWHTTPLAP